MTEDFNDRKNYQNDKMQKKAPKEIKNQSAVGQKNKSEVHHRINSKPQQQAQYPQKDDDSFIDGTGEIDQDGDQQDKSSQMEEQHQEIPQTYSKNNDSQKKQKELREDHDSNIKHVSHLPPDKPQNNNTQSNKDPYLIQNNSALLQSVPDKFSNTPIIKENKDFRQSPIGATNNSINKTKSDNSSVNQSMQVEKLLQQNQNLREQLKEMATLLDEIVEKERDQRQQKLGISTNGNKGIENEQIKQRRKELQKQTELISSNRILIQQKKRQLEFNFDINRITEKENEVKRLKKQLDEINSEKQGIQKISEQQKKAKNEIDRQEYKDQLEFVKKQFLSVKEENLKLNQELKQKDNELKKYIDELKARTDKIKSVATKYKEQKKKKTIITKEPEEEVSEEALSILEEKVKVLEVEKTNLEKAFVEKMKSLEKERKQQQAIVDKKLLVLKEREKSLKLTQLKIKEITKFIKATATENEKKQQNAANQQQQQQQQQQEEYEQQQQQQPPRRNNATNKVQQA